MEAMTFFIVPIVWILQLPRWWTKCSWRNIRIVLTYRVKQRSKCSSQLSVLFEKRSVANRNAHTPACHRCMYTTWFGGSTRLVALWSQARPCHTSKRFATLQRRIFQQTNKLNPGFLRWEPFRGLAASSWSTIPPIGGTCELLRSTSLKWFICVPFYGI